MIETGARNKGLYRVAVRSASQSGALQLKPHLLELENLLMLSLLDL